MQKFLKTIFFFVKTGKNLRRIEKFSFFASKITTTDLHISISISSLHNTFSTLFFCCHFPYIITSSSSVMQNDVFFDHFMWYSICVTWNILLLVLMRQTSEFSIIFCKKSFKKKNVWFAPENFILTKTENRFTDLKQHKKGK